MIENKIGVLFSGEWGKVVKKELLVGEFIPKHSHPESLVFVTVIEGEMVPLINDAPKNHIKKGDVFHFDGVNSISFKGIAEHTLFTVTLIHKSL